MGKADGLLLGAIDMHCHGYPELSDDVPNRYMEVEKWKRKTTKKE